MRFRTWNVRSLYNTDLNTKLTREVAKYKSNAGVLQVREDKGGTETTENYTFFYKNGKWIINEEEHSLFVQKRVILAVTRTEFVTWCTTR